MSDALALAKLLTQGITPPQGSSDIGFHTGQIVSWDESSGTNVVTVQGVDMSDLKALQGGIGVLYQPGDVVGLIRFQTTYFVLGKVAAPGAGAANQIRSAQVNTTVPSFTSASYADMPGSPGPELDNVYIGSSRRCLVLVSAFIVGNQSYGFMGFQVTGASTISPGGASRFAVAGTAGGGATQVGSTASAVVLLTSADGLNQGFHTVVAKYATTLSGTGTAAGFAQRSLTVIPF